MKKLQPVFWFVLVSVIWLSVFGLLFGNFVRENRELGRIGELRQELENLNFYRRSMTAVDAELERLKKGEQGPNTSGEFVARLPEMAQKAGIRRISIESLPARKNQPQGMMDLKLVLGGEYAEIASFVQAVEQSAVPVQVIGAEIESAGQTLNAQLVISVRRSGEASRE